MSARLRLMLMLPVSRATPTLREVIRAYVDQTLKVTGGNKSEAARLLGMHRSRLRRIVATPKRRKHRGYK